MFGTGRLSNQTCFQASAFRLNVSNSNGPVFSHAKAHLCVVDSCTLQTLPTICATEGATVLDCTIVTTASDCSQMQLVCTDPVNGGPQTFHTLGAGRARAGQISLGAPFVDRAPVLTGTISMFHEESANPGADCGQRLIGQNGAGD